MRKDETFAVLASLMPVDFMIIDEMIESKSAWVSMTTCHNEAIKEAREGSAFLVFIIPDFVYSDGSFRKLVELADKGYKGVLVFQLGAIRDAFIETYLSSYYDPAGRRAVIPPQDLIELWRKHQHPTSNFFLWDSRHYPNDLTSLFGWKDNNGSFVVRSSQFTPFFLYPETDYLLPVSGTVSETLDTVLAKNIIKDPSTVYIICDSREAVQVEMRPMTEGYVVPFDRPNLPMIACHLNWFQRHGNGNADYLEKEVWFYPKATDLPKEGLSEYSSSIYRNIKDMADFSTVDQFTSKVNKYFRGLINDRRIMVLGKGYIADITNDYLRNSGFDCSVGRSVNELKGNEFVFLAAGMSEMEMFFTHLEIRGLQYELDFLITPFIYRHFRKLLQPPYSWRRYYFDYYLALKKNGARWTLMLLWRKLAAYYRRFGRNR